MNNVLFNTGGNWDTTTLHNNNQEFPASELLVELHAGRDEDGEPAVGGVRLGGEMTAIIRPQDTPEQEFGIFPGILKMVFPGHVIEIQNTHPAFAFEFTRIMYNGTDATAHVVDLYVDINAVDNIVKAYITLYKPHWIGSDEVATYTIL